MITLPTAKLFFIAVAKISAASTLFSEARVNAAISGFQRLSIGIKGILSQGFVTSVIYAEWPFLYDKMMYIGKNILVAKSVVNNGFRRFEGSSAANFSPSYPVTGVMRHFIMPVQIGGYDIIYILHIRIQSFGAAGW